MMVEATTHPNPISWITRRPTMVMVHATADTPTAAGKIRVGKQLTAGVSKSEHNSVFMTMVDPETRVSSMFGTKNHTVSGAIRITAIETMTSIDGNEATNSLPSKYPIQFYVRSRDRILFCLNSCEPNK